MPELPEVETTLRGISPHLLGHTISHVTIRQAKLRWPIPRGLSSTLHNQVVQSAQRRGKYILLVTPAGTLIIHLGMSGSLRVLPCHTPHDKHDHIDIEFSNGKCLRLHDPRRFGCVLFEKGDVTQHALLNKLGPEPLEQEFNSAYLFELSRKRKVAVKNFIMDSHIVVGVGNIYASEALFKAGIRPTRTAGRVTQAEYTALVKTIKQTLQAAIKQGGTTLRDFTQSDGKPGYFKQKLAVYGRTGEPCLVCTTPIKQKTIGQRSSFYCPVCQR